MTMLVFDRLLSEQYFKEKLRGSVKRITNNNIDEIVYKLCEQGTIEIVDKLGYFSYGALATTTTYYKVRDYEKVVVRARLLHSELIQRESG